MILGVVLQFLCLCIFVAKYRKIFLTLVGFYFLLIAFIYSGFSVSAQVLTGSTWISGRTVSKAAQGDWVLLIALAMVTYLLAYVVFDKWTSLRLKGKPETKSPREQPILQFWIFFPLGLITIYFALSGSLWSPQIFSDIGWNLGYFSIGLTRDLLWITPSLAAISVLSRFGMRAYWFVVPSLLLLITLIGSRSLIIATALILLVVGCWLGMRFGYFKILLTMALSLFLVLGLMQLRIDVGRAEIVNSEGILTRLSLVVESISNLRLPFTSTTDEFKPNGASDPNTSLETRPDLDVPEPAGQRFDGNSIPAAIWTSYRNGTNLIGTSGLLDELALSIPQFIYHEKLTTPLETRHAKAAIAKEFGLLPPNFPMDFLATQSGASLAFWGPIGVPIFFGFVAFLHAMTNFYRRRSNSVYSALVSTAVLVCALSYEQTLYIYGTVGRATLLLILITWVTEKLISHTSTSQYGTRHKKSSEISEQHTVERN